MLEDKDILPVCRYWARRLWRKGEESKELLAVCYLQLKSLRDIRLAQKNAKYSILHFIQQERSWLIPEEFDRESKSCSIDRKVEEEDFFLSLVKRARLSTRQIEIVRMRFFEDLNLEEIAEKLNVRQQSVQHLLAAALQKMADVLPEKE